MSDANDAAILLSALTGDAKNIDGSNANGWDIATAVAGVIVPVVSGSAVKKILKEGGDKLMKNVDDGVDYVVSPNGNVASTSQNKMKEGFEKANFPSKPTNSPGKQYDLPDDNSVRVMEPQGPNGRRAVFQNKNGQPVNQDFKTVNPPKGLTRSERKHYIRERTHLKQNE